MKKLIVLVILISLVSCTNRYFTPERAANTGGKTCRDKHRIR